MGLNRLANNDLGVFKTTIQEDIEQLNKRIHSLNMTFLRLLHQINQPQVPLFIEEEHDQRTLTMVHVLSTTDDWMKPQEIRQGYRQVTGKPLPQSTLRYYLIRSEKTDKKNGMFIRRGKNRSTEWRLHRQEQNQLEQNVET